MNKVKKYIVEDFVNYHAGNMPEHDMHALEKAALEDPFLSDALEGYSFANTATKDIEQLYGELKIGKENSFVVKKTNNKTWWKVAASVVTLLGLGYLFTTINKNSNNNTLAKNEQVKQINIDSLSDNELKLDSLSTLDKTLVESNKLQEEVIAEKNITAKQQIVKPVQSTEAEIAADLSVTAPTAAPVAIYKEEEKMKVEIKESVANNDLADKKIITNTQNQLNLNNNYNYSGIVQKAKGGPMQNATIRTKNVVTQTDQNGRFNFTASDSNVNASIAAVGFEKQNVVLNKNTTLVFKLENDNKYLQEAVVLSGTSKQKRQNINNALAGKVSSVIINSSGQKLFNPAVKREMNTDEEKEIKDFNNYIINNIKQEFDKEGKVIKGKVVLFFSINKNGQPQNIEIVQSLNNRYDKQVIQLLKNYTKWSTTNNTQKTVSINF